MANTIAAAALNPSGAGSRNHKASALQAVMGAMTTIADDDSEGEPRSPLHHDEPCPILGRVAAAWGTLK